MSDRLGLEITRTHVRAVALAAWGNRPRAVAEVPWDAEHPAAAVGALSSRFGRVGRIALSVGLDYLHVKHVDLPPAPARVRRLMIAVEPDRFFPVQDEPSRVLVISRGWLRGHSLTHEIQAVYAIAGNRLTLVRWRERDL